MHELGIVLQIVDLARARIEPSARVTRVSLEIGKLSMIVGDSIRFCFSLAAEGTPLAGARLDIIEIAAEGRCRACGEGVVVNDPLERCACGNGDVEWQRGTGIRILELEVTDVHDMRV